MDATDVWVANGEGTEIVRARDIAGVSLDYDGNITVRLTGRDGAVVTVARHRTHREDTDLTTFTASWLVSSPNCRTRLGHSWCGQYTTRLVAGSGSASRCRSVLAQATGPRLRGSRIPDPRDQERIHLCPALPQVELVEFRP